MTSNDNFLLPFKMKSKRKKEPQLKYQKKTLNEYITKGSCLKLQAEKKARTHSIHSASRNGPCKKSQPIYIAQKVSECAVFLACIFLHSDWIQRCIEKIFVFNPNTGKYGPEKLRIRTLIRQCENCASRRWNIRFNFP